MNTYDYMKFRMDALQLAERVLNRKHETDLEEWRVIDDVQFQPHAPSAEDIVAEAKKIYNYIIFGN